MITQHAVTIWSLCSFFTHVLNFLDKNYLNKVGAEYIICLLQSIEKKIF